MFSCLIELIGFAFMLIASLVRMTVLRDAPAYVNNALMAANPFALGCALVIFGLFNVIFIGGFFRTAYKFARPFVTYIVVSMLFLTAAEVLHHIPGLEALNAFGFNSSALQFSLLAAGAVIYALLTFVSYKKACADFELIDL